MVVMMTVLGCDDESGDGIDGNCTGGDGTDESGSGSGPWVRTKGAPDCQLADNNTCHGSYEWCRICHPSCGKLSAAAVRVPSSP